MIGSASRFNIIIDAMGGDHAPDEIISGAIQGCKDIDVDLHIVGNNNVVISSAEQNNISLKDIDIINTTELVNMDDSPSEVLKHKKDSSINKGTIIASKYKNSAFLSAGNTGAVMACSVFNMGKIEGVLRPAIAVVIPLSEKKFVLIDAGANVDIKPMYLKQFAIMGKVYCREILKISEPRIGLINVGSEEKKGSEVVVEGYRLLKDSNINFVGNVEGRDIFEGKSDVVVCDGFIGNVMLKSVEGMAGFFFDEIKNLFKENFITKISALMVKKYLKQMKKRFDYEEYGGAFLLGINGITIISHGSSRSKAIKNAISVAYEGMKSNLINKIKKEIKS